MDHVSATQRRCCNSELHPHMPNHGHSMLPGKLTARRRIQCHTRFGPVPRVGLVVYSRSL